MKTLNYAIVAGAALLFAGSAAVAQQHAVAKACAADIKTLCADIKPGEGRIRDCIKAHFPDLTPPCQEVVMRVRAVMKACKGDIKQFCADVKPGEGRIEACMKTHSADVSDPCKDAMSAATAGKS